MKNMTEKNVSESGMELFAVAPIAEQILQDIGHIYTGRNTSAGDVGNLCELSFPELELKKGELVVIASRTIALADQFRLRVSLNVALDQKLSVLLFGVLSSTAKFTQQLVEVMADIEVDSPIYEGQLNDDELDRVRPAMAQLRCANIYLAKGIMNRIDLQIQAAKIQNEIERIGLMLVDSVQWLKDETSPTPNLEQNLIRLKHLAVELDIPVLALYRLDPTEDKHPSTLTRSELRNAEVMAKLTDVLLLLSGSYETIVLERPKVTFL